MSKSWMIRKDQEAVSPVIATILMVAITVVLAAVLYVMVSMFTNIQPETRPVVTFGPIKTEAPSLDNATASWELAGISKGDTLFSSYKVVILMDDAPLTTAQKLQQNTIIPSGGTVRLIVRDLGGEGYLSIGDRFLVYGMGPGHSWTFSLIWGNDNSEIQDQSWDSI